MRLLLIAALATMVWGCAPEGSLSSNDITSIEQGDQDSRYTVELVQGGQVIRTWEEEGVITWYSDNSIGFGTKEGSRVTVRGDVIVTSRQ